MSASELSAEDRELCDRFTAAGQGHVFRFLPRLPAHERRALLAQARRIDLDLVGRLAAPVDAKKDRGPVEPPGDEVLTHAATAERAGAARERGLALLRDGHVAVVIAAGGQGTRLGHAAPKGMWPVGPASGKTLLHWHCEKVRWWSRESGHPIPVAVMVSEATARATDRGARPSDII